MSRIQNQKQVYNSNNNNNNQPLNVQYMKNQHMNQKQTNNILKKHITPNLNLNNRNISNNTNQARNPNTNLNQNTMNNYNNNIMNSNDELGKALLIIRRECKKKDDKIRELEKKVSELTNKLMILLKYNNNNNIDLNNDFENVGGMKPFSKAQDDNNFESNDNKDGEIVNRMGRGYSFGYSLNNRNNQRSNSYIQNFKDNVVNYNSDSEKVPNKRFPGIDNMSHSNDHSILTYNGGSSQTSSKAEVKNYLKEVKSKIEPQKFKEFIRNIKLLTAKNNSTFNKDLIVESVRKLFGETNKDLFIKFQYIIGAKR